MATKRLTPKSDEMTNISLTYLFDYPYNGFPQEITIYFQTRNAEKAPFVALTWITPDGREFLLNNTSVPYNNYSYNFSSHISYRGVVAENENWQKWFVFGNNYPTPSFYILFADPRSETPKALNGTYTLRIDGITFNPGADLDAQVIILGQIYGWAGTDYMRRDLIVPLLWGLPFALLIGGVGAVITTLASLLMAAAGVWFGGWFDALIQRLIEANIILPVVAIAVLAYSYYGYNLWAILIAIVFLNTFGAPTKTFRAAFLQVKEQPYMEAARAYGASNWRIITKYLIPRILPVIIPQLVSLIPAFVFLEATLGIFGINDARYPTWGRVLFLALRYGGMYGSSFWVLEPIALLLLTGLAFVLLGFALNRILNPRLVVN